MRNIISYHLEPAKIVTLSMESDAEVISATHFGIPELHVLSGDGPVVNREFLLLNRGSVPDNAKHIATIPVEVPGSRGSIAALHIFELIGGSVMQ